MKQIKVYITAEQWADKRLQVYLSPVGQQEAYSYSEGTLEQGIDKILRKLGFELIEPETKPEQSQPSEIPTDKVEAVKYFLNQLPEGYRQRALAQVDEENIEKWKETAISISDALMFFNNWYKTEEGNIFWLDVHNFYKYPTEYPTLPPLPND